MKYQKPELNFSIITSNSQIASAGLGEWLGQNGFEADTVNYISTYAINS